MRLSRLRPGGRLRESRRFWSVAALVCCLVLGAEGLWAGQSVALPWTDLLRRGVEIYQWSSLTDAQEVRLGQSIHRQLIGQEFAVYPDAVLTDYVTQVGERLVAGTSRNLPYTFTVIRSPQVNAFATMGGFVYVTTGLLGQARNEAELAGVIGHEIGHITGRHVVKQMQQMAVAQGIATAAGLDSNRLTGLGLELALRRPRSREAELDADRRALRYVLAAGYDPSGLLNFIRGLAGRPAPPSFLSTHPAPQERLTALAEQVPPQTEPGLGLDEIAYRLAVQNRLP